MGISYTSGERESVHQANVRHVATKWHVPEQAAQVDARWKHGGGKLEWDLP